jgi:hypothetical protein
VTVELVNHYAEKTTIAAMENFVKVRCVQPVVDRTQDVQIVYLVLISVVLTPVKVLQHVELMLLAQYLNIKSNAHVLSRWLETLQ